jgi:hypothetical protein
MRRYWPILALCILTAACSGSPTAPAPTPVQPAPTPQPVQSMISASACPTALVFGFALDLGFYQQIACNAFEGPLVATRRWTQAPKLYIRTVDESGSPIDAVTLQTVESAMVGIAPSLTGGKFGVSVERGTEQRDGVSGWITVRWMTTTQGPACAQSDVAKDGGDIEFDYKVANCSCSGSALKPRTAQHELGHALGYQHTDSADDLMSNVAPVKPCQQVMSAREQSATAYHYR